jgi:hypothetical protein
MTMDINTENSLAVMSVIKEIMDDGSLWVSFYGETFYIPELLEQLKKLDEHDTLNS